MFTIFSKRDERILNSKVEWAVLEQPPPAPDEVETRVGSRTVTLNFVHVAPEATFSVMRDLVALRLRRPFSQQKYASIFGHAHLKEG